MKILVISERWWPEGTGGILASHLISRVLRDSGFELLVVHGTKKPVIIEGINYIYSGLLSARNKYRLWLNCFVLTKQPWFVKVVQKCDVVYIPRICYPLIPFVKKLGKKVVVHLHDYQPVSYSSIVYNGEGGESLSDIIRFEVLEHGSISRAIFGAFMAPVNILAKLWLREADAVICVSRRQAKIISRRIPELARKIRVVYNPLPEIPPLEEKLENPAFTYAGGGSYVKGFHIFIKAALNILKRGRNVDFMITGGSRAFQYQQIKFIERLNNMFTGVFRLLGHIPYEDVLKLYSRSSAILVPSIWEEPLPYVIMEATAMGTIPVASRIGGIPEIVEGTYAEKTLFTPGSVEEMIDRMEVVLSMSREGLVDIGYKLREYVLRKFDRETIALKLFKIFEA
ncbi:MAG: hypothetical protein B6U76_06235 [Desulfurococcales archaeon ex4484_217_2]|nr:MAG: hypothetical protein B6U76_06235 [Desulfurococcales archaeon ex4484_217_2]